MDYPQFARRFSSLGHTFPPSDELVSELNQFTCLLYGDKSSSNVNVCRHNLFKSGKCSDDLLPPTCDSLSKHIERANFQSAVWLQCLTAKQTIPSPINNGWTLNNGELEMVWMTRPPAPDALLDSINCKCKTECKTFRCSCKKANLACTDLCSCCDCQNSRKEMADKDQDVLGEVSNSDDETDSCDEFY